MIRIQKSPTADTRTCDHKKVTREQLRASSKQHISDVRLALNFFAQHLYRAGAVHDLDKITDLDSFHKDFSNGFKTTDWWDRHRSLNRHHLAEKDGIPQYVNLIDVLDYIADCVMAGMARSGAVRPVEIDPKLLMAAFENTVQMLQREVLVEDA